VYRLGPLSFVPVIRVSSPFRNGRFPRLGFGVPLGIDRFLSNTVAVNPLPNLVFLSSPLKMVSFSPKLSVASFRLYFPGPFCFSAWTAFPERNKKCRPQVTLVFLGLLPPALTRTSCVFFETQTARCPRALRFKISSPQTCCPPAQHLRGVLSWKHHPRSNPNAP